MAEVQLITNISDTSMDITGRINNTPKVLTDVIDDSTIDPNDRFIMTVRFNASSLQASISTLQEIGEQVFIFYGRDWLDAQFGGQDVARFSANFYFSTFLSDFTQVSRLAYLPLIIGKTGDNRMRLNVTANIYNVTDGSRATDSEIQDIFSGTSDILPIRIDQFKSSIEIPTQPARQAVTQAIRTIADTELDFQSSVNDSRPLTSLVNLTEAEVNPNDRFQVSMLINDTQFENDPLFPSIAAAGEWSSWFRGQDWLDATPAPVANAVSTAASSRFHTARAQFISGSVAYRLFIALNRMDDGTFRYSYSIGGRNITDGSLANIPLTGPVPIFAGESDVVPFRIIQYRAEIVAAVQPTEEPRPVPPMPQASGYVGPEEWLVAFLRQYVNIGTEADPLSPEVWALAQVQSAKKIDLPAIIYTPTTPVENETYRGINQHAQNFVVDCRAWSFEEAKHMRDQALVFLNNQAITKRRIFGRASISSASLLDISQTGTDTPIFNAALEVAVKTR